MIDEVTGLKHKLVNFSPFLTDWLDLERPTPDRLEFLLLLVLDFDGPTFNNSEYWIEGKTEALNHIKMRSLSGQYTISLNGKEHCLKVMLETNKRKAILMSELSEDEIVEGIIQFGNNRGTCKNLQLVLRSSATSVEVNSSENITKVKLVTKSSDFTQMPEARISEIAALFDINLQRLPKSNIISTKTKKKHSIARPCTPPAAAAVTTIIPEHTKYMFECFTKNKFCDITIHGPDDHEINAHKCVLYSGSSIWRQLLTNNDQLSIITIPDFERDTIETLVTFIYIGFVQKPPKQTDQLLISAEMYGVDGLKTWCEQQLITTITIDTAINLLVLAHKYNGKTLLEHVWKFVRKNTAELMKRNEWTSAFLSYPDLTLKLFNTLL